MFRSCCSGVAPRRSECAGKMTSPRMQSAEKQYGGRKGRVFQTGSLRVTSPGKDCEPPLSANDASGAIVVFTQRRSSKG